jgi:orotate phosphoribosyltransferase
MPSLDQYTQSFLRAALDAGALQFGEFTLKSGRVSPYFFNAGLFNSGATISALAQAYAGTLAASSLAFDMLFGPAYKGITLAAVTSAALFQQHQRDVPFAYNRKEAKDHGEGGMLVGAKLAGRVLIVDDVISAGTSVRESVRIIRAAGAVPAGVLIALDRCERGLGTLSAAQEVAAEFGFPVLAAATLPDLLQLVSADDRLQRFQAAMAAYRQRYGVSA